jgi:hypothetical protein
MRVCVVLCDCAVIAETLGIDWQVVFGSVVVVYGILACVAESAACIVFFNTLPAGTAGRMIDFRCIFNTMRPLCDEPVKVTVLAVSFVVRIFLFTQNRGCSGGETPPIIG